MNNRISLWLYSQKLNPPKHPDASELLISGGLVLLRAAAILLGLGYVQETSHTNINVLSAIDGQESSFAG